VGRFYELLATWCRETGLGLVFLSPSTRRRDLGLERERYALAGVQEYWVVEPVGERVEVFRLDGAELLEAEERWRKPGELLRSPLLPGFGPALEELYRSW